MTPYIAHRRFRGRALCNGDAADARVNIPAMTELELHGEIICLPDGRPVACRHSQNGIAHFARNDDGKGMLRGRLTHAIAFGSRRGDGQGHRFTEEERKMLVSEYIHWLEPLDQIIFNNDFYDADIADLQELAGRLGITIKER